MQMKDFVLKDLFLDDYLYYDVRYLRDELEGEMDEIQSLKDENELKNSYLKKLAKK
jgi:hypothetical protein